MRERERGWTRLVLYNAAPTLNRRKRERERSTVIRLVKAKIPERRLGRRNGIAAAAEEPAAVGMGSLTLETLDQQRRGGGVDTTTRNHWDFPSVTS